MAGNETSRSQYPVNGYDISLSSTFKNEIQIRGSVGLGLALNERGPSRWNPE